MFHLLKKIAHLSNHHKEDIRVLIENYLELNLHAIEIDDDLLNQASSTRDNHQKLKNKYNFWELMILLFRNGGGWRHGFGSIGSPGLTPTERYQESLATFFIKLNIFLNNPYNCCEQALLNVLSTSWDFSLNLLSLIINNYGWVAPLLYLIREYIVFIKNKYYFTLQYRVPSHRVYGIDNFDYLNKERRVIKLMDFIRTLSVTLRESNPKVKWSNFMKFRIPSYYYLKNLCDRLGLVSVNRLNLSFDTVHHSYAGAGLKSIINNIYKFSSILVQIITYSQLHGRKVYTIFNILLIGGIGVVVWYKYLNHWRPTFIIPEPHAWFKNPTTVVEGYKRVTFWLSEDPNQLHKIVRNTYLYNQPFTDIINLHQFWGWEGMEMVEKDRVTYIGLAIMIATFLTTGILKTTMPMPMLS